MSDVVNKTTLEYRKAQHTNDYMNGEWLINPVLPNCEQKYWKIKSGKVAEMTASEKTAKDAELAAQAKEVQKDMLIAVKIQEITRAEAIQALKDDGVLDANGDIVGG
jgi:hypothetical protein